MGTWAAGRGLGRDLRSQGWLSGDAAVVHGPGRVTRAGGPRPWPTWFAMGLCRRYSGRSKDLGLVAEREGFEPSRGRKAPTRFPVAPVRPLRHLSLTMWGPQDSTFWCIGPRGGWTMTYPRPRDPAVIIDSGRFLCPSAGGLGRTGRILFKSGNLLGMFVLPQMLAPTWPVSIRPSPEGLLNQQLLEQASNLRRWLSRPADRIETLSGNRRNF